MIYIVCAFYHEAEPFIEYYKLSKIIGKTYFDKYEGNNVKLAISGIGKINSAVALARLIPENGLSGSDIVVNIGICGSQTEKVESCFLVDKINDSDTNKSFYPDILFKHNFIEGTLITSSKPEYVINLQEKIVDNHSEKLLYDMEGSGFYEAASKFVSPHQIYLIKIVSDNLVKQKITGEWVRNIINANMNNIVSFIEKVQNSLAAVEFMSESDYEIIEKISGVLRLTESMKRAFTKKYIKYKIREQNIPDFLSKYKNIKVNIKNDVRLYFTELMEEFSK